LPAKAFSDGWLFYILSKPILTAGFSGRGPLKYLTTMKRRTLPFLCFFASQSF